MFHSRNLDSHDDTMSSAAGMDVIMNLSVSFFRATRCRSFPRWHIQCLSKSSLSRATEPFFGPKARDWLKNLSGVQQYRENPVVHSFLTLPKSSEFVEKVDEENQKGIPAESKSVQFLHALSHRDFFFPSVTFLHQVEPAIAFALGDVPTSSCFARLPPSGTAQRRSIVVSIALFATLSVA